MRPMCITVLATVAILWQSALAAPAWDLGFWLTRPAAGILGS